MDLYIRTQDKKWLTKADDIYVSKESEYEYSIRSRCILGKYKTEERALEILDEIQKIMTLITKTIIYKMPQE